ncbi:MAG TPA: hypothetical protein VF132_10320, partial [Rudaea sp.]
MLVFFVAVLPLLSSTVDACTATTPDVFTVGATTDHDCTYHTLSDAVTAATCPAGTKIYLTDSISYTGQINITDKNISLIGKPDGVHCGPLTAACGTLLPCPTAPLRTISGTLKIRGTSNVTIQYLTISNGHGVADSHGTTYGGGIDYAATGTLHITTSSIEDNTANNGGGIRFQGYGGSAELFLHSHTLIDGNEATNGGSGGGLRVEGDALVHIDEPAIWIHDNIAADKGGGIAIVGGSTVHIGSSGDALFGTPVGVVSYNTANHGGGIAVIAESTGAAAVDIYPTDANHPVRIDHNKAHSTGGGIYADSWVSGGVSIDSAGGYVFMGGGHIDDNKAKEGSGIYLDVDSNKGSYLNLYSGYCAVGVECNTVSNNLAVDIDHQDGSGNDLPTAGSAMLLQTQSYLVGRQLTMRGNHGAHALRVADSLDGQLELDTCLFAGNVTTDYLIAMGDATATFTQCTFADNTVGSPALIHTAPTFTLTNSIFKQGSVRAIDSNVANPNLTLDY